MIFTFRKKVKNKNMSNLTKQEIDQSIIQLQHALGNMLTNPQEFTKSYKNVCERVLCRMDPETDDYKRLLTTCSQIACYTMKINHSDQGLHLRSREIEMEKLKIITWAQTYVFLRIHFISILIACFSFYGGWKLLHILETLDVSSELFCGGWRYLFVCRHVGSFLKLVTSELLIFRIGFLTLCGIIVYICMIFIQRGLGSVDIQYKNQDQAPKAPRKRSHLYLNGRKQPLKLRN